MTVRWPINWEYYIQPAEQTDEVNAQLKQLIDVRISEDGDTLNPESITVLDPACGSGHILVEAYDCLKAIYLERGYRSRDIPRLILENNLYGIDIDTRAAQLASFALLMKAREDDRRLFSNPPKLNIIALQDSQPERLDALSQDLANTGIAQADLKELLELFEHASTFGSLIQVPEVFAKKLPDLETKLNIALASGDIFAQQSAQELLPLVQQANLLAKQYDAVIANPPYMGGKGMNTALKDFAKKKFPDSKSDLFAMFIERGFGWCKESGFNSMVTMQSWMFLSSYEAMREKLLQDRTIQTMAHLGARAFPEISGEVVQTTAFVMQGQHINGFKPVFFRLVDTGQDQKESELRSGLNRFDSTIQDDFKKIPGSPIAYWVNIQTRNLFSGNKLLGEISEPRRGLATNDNNKFIRRWAEVSNQKMAFGSINREDAKNSNKKWFPYNKGGEFRKWYGNNEYLVNWENDGEEMFALAKKLYGSPTRTIKNLQYYFRNGISWSMIGSGTFSVRYMDNGYIFDQAADSLFARNNELLEIIGLMNSPVLEFLKIIINPTMNTTAGVISQLPYVPFSASNQARENVEEMIKFARDDWNVYETSWDFTQNPIIRTQQSNLEQAFNTWQQQNADAVAEMKRLEEENNKLFIDAYGLQDELTPDVPDEQITLTRADREKDSQRLVSYVLGCMMGRYSLDEPGLIYAHAGNQDFDANRYLKFPADADGIIPLTEMHWFEDDATHRIREFLTAVWGKDTLDANMQWLAESLDKKANETAEDTIRRYLASKFYKDHMQTYKKRPIYWLFSSGKQGAFQALVYLHRYNESTLARMRTEYVMPLISKMAAYANSLETTKESSDSAAEIKRIEKKLQDLHKQQAELSTFEEKLRHYADQRITLDLDDGVKVNYGKFGDLLAEVKAITGDKTE
ncbi:BREX-1 system adenine-specific DNA-methyltransferase PglX [Acinetobacter seifertii]|uniref:BREX-1 system adenine-specific DNA-methyltransferase PglX n=1 Tax=Acinetobacter seifertii TaxID=1530123 RepID=UPI00374DACDF